MYLQGDDYQKIFSGPNCDYSANCGACGILRLTSVETMSGGDNARDIKLRLKRTRSPLVISP